MAVSVNVFEAPLHSGELLDAVMIGLGWITATATDVSLTPKTVFTT